MLYVGISGSRAFENDKKFIFNCLDMFFNREKIKNRKITMVHGNARGVDKISGEYASDNNIPCEVISADWDTHGKSAGYIRNGEIAKKISFLIAIWNGKSKGTKHMIDLATKEEIPYIVFCKFN